MENPVFHHTCFADLDDLVAGVESESDTVAAIAAAGLACPNTNLLRRVEPVLTM